MKKITIFLITLSLLLFTAASLNLNALETTGVYFFESSFENFGEIEQEVNIAEKLGLNPNYFNIYITTNYGDKAVLNQDKLILTSDRLSARGNTLNIRPANGYTIDKLTLNIDLNNTTKAKIMIDGDEENALEHSGPRMVEFSNKSVSHFTIQNIFTGSLAYPGKNIHITGFSVRIKKINSYINYYWEKQSDGYEYLIYDNQEVFQKGELILDIANPEFYNIQWAPIYKDTGEFTEDQNYYNNFDLKSDQQIKLSYDFASESLIQHKLIKQSEGIRWDLKTTYADSNINYFGFSIRRTPKSFEPPPEQPPENPDDIITTPINQLPRTAVSSLEFDVGQVWFYVHGANVIVQISYNDSVYYLKYDFVGHEASMELFEATEAYYINKDGNPSIFINHTNYPYLLDIMQAPDDEKPAFVPHTIWDLKTDNLKTIDQYAAYAHLKQMEAGPIIAYTYIDEFVMDKILSIQVSWTQRQYNGFPVSLWQKYTKWEQQIETYTDNDYLTYRNLYSNWEHWIPVWQFLKLAKQLSTFYEMPRIDSINWANLQPEYNITKAELESYFSKLDPNFNGLKNNPRYKVWAIALQAGKKSSGGFAQTEFYYNENDVTDERNFHIIHITYETNGKLYHTVGSHMNLFHSVDKGLLPSEKRLSLTAVIAFLVLGVILFSAFKAKAFSSPSKAISFIIGTAIVIGFMLIAYKLIIDSDLLSQIGP